MILQNKINKFKKNYVKTVFKQNLSLIKGDFITILDVLFIVMKLAWEKEGIRTPILCSATVNLKFSLQVLRIIHN